MFVGFDLFKTDLPLRVAFPLILANSLRWLQPVGLEGSDLMVSAGTPFLLSVEHGVDEGTVRDPDGASHRAEITRGALSFAQTDRVGLYTLTTGGNREVKFAVNLLDGVESNIRPQSLPVAPPPTAGEVGDSFTYQRELWPFLLGLAMLTLALEGFLYWRRQTAGRLVVAPAGVGPVGAGKPRRRAGSPRMGTHPAHVHPMAGPAERLLRAGHVRQRQPRRA